MLEHVIITAACKSLLVIGSAHVGNNIFCTPAIRFLKRNFPALRLDALSTRAGGASAFRGNPDVTTTHVAQWSWQIRRIANRYSAVLSMFNDRTSGSLGSLRVPHAVIAHESSVHRADHRLEFARLHAGGTILPADRQYVVNWDAADAEGIRRELRETRGDDILIGLHLGCGRTSAHGWKFWYRGRDQTAKLWPLERYIELAHELQRASPRIRLVITGSANERFLARRFVAAVPGTIDLVGKTSIGSVAALMSRLRMFITQDTGILHVACSTDVPLIALFGPTNLIATGPYPQVGRRTVIRREAMSDITPREVCAAALLLLTQFPSPVSGAASGGIPAALPSEIRA